MATDREIDTPKKTNAFTEDENHIAENVAERNFAPMEEKMDL